jgi:trehalose/maltose hydrolase-like predicted phosphorylase
LIDRTFEAIIFDWDGMSERGDRSPARRRDVAAVRSRVEALCAAGVHVFLVSDIDVATVDRQLRARPAGPGRLHLCLGHGSEVYGVDGDGPELRWRRTASENEATALDGAANGVVERLSVRRTSSESGLAELGRGDGSDTARFAAAWLDERGITGALVLVVGDEFGPVGGVAGRDSHLLVPELERAVVVSVGEEPGGVPSGVTHLAGSRTQFLALLDEQLARRRDHRVPDIDTDPAWVVVLPDRPGMDRAAEAIGTLANGWVGVRGVREEDGPGTMPLLVANGVYTSGAEPRLLAGPVWTDLTIGGGVPDERVLDLRTGVLLRTTATGVRTLRFVSAARPEVLALRAEGPASHLKVGAPFTTPDPGERTEHLRRGSVRLTRATDPAGAGIVVAARDRHRARGERRLVERLAAWVADGSHHPTWDDAARRLAGVEGLGFNRLLAEHREACARRWVDAAVSIEGSPEDELAARFAVFQLLGSSPDVGEAAVGARGLTGAAYGGHVFWDADVYVLPALAAIRPGAARAMLEYRVRRLPAARATAEAQGLRGARFPWESAADGTDVTPRGARGRHGELIPIRTGEQEEHIVAAVAWAACEYVAWTGDREFLTGPGADLVLETARYWASGLRVDHEGRGHLTALMGPDEYHEDVDDNAYTNVMARWNLGRAAQLVDECGGDAAEAADWRRLAASLADGWDATRGLYEQFAGYWALEPLCIADFAQPPVAADVLLGADRVAGSQLIKQADVLMLHHLVPDEVVRGSLAANLAFYEPRTSHGSSLSPAIHAALFARVRRPERALELFRLAARLDLDDVTGSTSAGLHLATMGGVWQALAYGFLGARPHGALLQVDPCLPATWKALSLRLRYRGGPIGVRADHDTVTVSCTHPLRIRVADGLSRCCRPPGGTFRVERTSG